MSVTGIDGATIVVVDDEEDTRFLLGEILRRGGHDVLEAESASACLEILRARTVDLVVTDVQMPGMSGIGLCEILRDRHPDLLAIVVTGLGDLQTAVSAIRAGAYDFITKPANGESLRLTITRALEHLATRREVRRLHVERSEEALPGIVGTSVAIRSAMRLTRRVAPSDASVLITGESGTGKELFARALHALSPRANEAFLAINCAAVPAELLESELFGHVKGAFTDAKSSRAGLFLQAGAGTVFLDEIGEMPMEMQPKLLRVLQERTVRPVGSDEETPLQARIITATNRDLESQVELGEFREDLFYRINVVSIPVPPLRDRAGDVPLLVAHVLSKIATRTNKPMKPLSPAALHKLIDYHWPGNIRELENSLERAVAVAQELVDVVHLPDKIRNYEPARFVLHTDNTDEMITLEEMHRRYVRQVLVSVGGNKTQAARVLGIDRRSIYRRLAEDKAQSDGSDGST